MSETQTRQRALPDILGWEPAPAEWGYTGPRWQHPTRGIVVDDRSGWDCDDMLLWLRKRGCDVKVGTIGAHLEDVMLLGERLMVVEVRPFEKHPSRFRGRTLHAALAAACWAVAETEGGAG